MTLPDVIYVIRDAEDGELYAYDRQPFTTTPAYIRKPDDCEIHTAFVEEKDGQGIVTVPANGFAEGEEVIVIISRKRP